MRCVAVADVRLTGLDMALESSGTVRVEVFGRKAMVVRTGETGTAIYNWAEDVFEDGWHATLYHKVVAHVACGLPATPDVFRRGSTHLVKRLRQLR